MTESRVPPPLGGGFTILKKGLLLAALPFLFQMIFIALVVWMRGQSQEAERWFVHTKVVIAQARAAYADLVEAHYAARGVVASGDDVFLADYKRAAQQATRTLEALYDQVADSPSQQAQVGEIAAQSAEFLLWLKQNTVPAPGRPAPTPSGRLDRNLLRESRERLDLIRGKLDAFLEEEERLDAARHEYRDLVGRRLDRVILAGAAVAVLGTLLLGYAFGRGISHRFAVLADNARRLAEGQELAAPLAGGDEITQVDHVFHQMAETLRLANRKERDYTTALEQQAAELGVANRELQEFASVASHDLQEPLRKIQAFGDRLRTTCGSALAGQGLDYLKRMQNAAGRMQTLINDLLSFSRVTTKGKPFEPVDLQCVASEVVSDLEGRLQQTGGRVEVGELPSLDADPMQMRQLLQNLIGNALKFHQPGEAPEVHVAGRKLDEAEAAWEISVRDNGIGFDEKYLDRIFNVFQRLHGRNEYEGTGMGLAICRKIVERHHGRITARSAPGQGSTFLVVLPAVAVRPDPLSAPEDDKVIPASSSESSVKTGAGVQGATDE